MTDNVTFAVADGNYLVQGVQLRRRLLVPTWLGNLLLWAFFHRTDTATEITVTGLSTGRFPTAVPNTSNRPKSLRAIRQGKA